MEDLENIPTTKISANDLESLTVLDLFVTSGLCSSKSEARKLISASGAYVNGQSVESESQIGTSLVKNGSIILRKGKKTFHKIIIA